MINQLYDKETLEINEDQYLQKLFEKEKLKIGEIKLKIIGELL